jgi:phospholipid/cholesterol/gamma-HCH transport system substrate-binding protein
METRPPTLGRIAIAAGFALSCFGLLLFLWLAFGGPVPLKPESYRVDIHFDEASQLAVESDVRISGVSVGKVKGIELGDDGLADATIEIDPKYAPIPSNAKAILRQKTLLGETYVELTPGNRDAAPLPEGGTLPTAQVSDAVQLDEIFRAFDEPTRAAFQTWMADAAVAFRGRGVDLNAAIGNLDPFAERADDLLRILDSQRLAVKKLLADGGATFDAISKQPGELRSLIQNTESVFSTTAARDTEIREIFQALPTFQDEARLTLERLDTFATDTNPLITQLRPVARQLSGTLIALKRLAPEAERFFHGLRPVIQRAQSGFGSLRVLLDDQLPPFLGRLDPYFNQLIPIVDTVNRYKGEVTSFLGNLSAALNGGSTPNGGTRLIKYLRAASPLGPGVLGSPPSPYNSSRLNAYVKAGGYTKLSQGLDSFFTANCTGGRTATLQQGDFSNDLYDRVQIYAMGGAGITNTDDVPAPPCRQQGTQSSIGGPPNQDTDYLHVNPEG